MNEDNLRGGFQTSADEERKRILLLPTADRFDAAFIVRADAVDAALCLCASASGSASTESASPGAASGSGTGSEERLLKVKRRLEMRIAELLQSHVIWFEGAVVASGGAADAADAAETTSTASGH